jgi:hypothetical protein
LAVFDQPAYFHYLSGPVIESILRDPKLRASECSLLQMLLAWAGSDDERHAVAKNLVKWIGLEEIDPVMLAKFATNSNLITKEQLTQANGARANGTTVVPRRARVKTFVDRPAVRRDSVPMEIQVVGAGSDCVNGIYTMVEIVDGWCQYAMAGGRFDEQECVFTLFRCIVSTVKNYWFISIADAEQPGTDLDIDFYRAEARQSSRYPHHSGVWRSSGSDKGVDPAPRLLYSTHWRHLD